MTNPQDIVTLGTGIVTLLLDNADDIGIKTAELRFEGQGVDIATPGIIVMLSPPASPDMARGLPQMQAWECTLFICPEATAIVAHSAVAAMTIAQKAHLLLRRPYRGVLNLDASEPFAIVSALPDNFICVVNYNVPFSLFP